MLRDLVKQMKFPILGWAQYVLVPPEWRQYSRFD